MLRVLGQRFPQEVDSAVAKVSRNVAKARAATSKASLRDDDGSDDADGDGDDINAAREKAALREEALASLLVSTFAGAELAQRMPLEQRQGEDVSVIRWGRPKFGVPWCVVFEVERCCRWLVRRTRTVFVHHATVYGSRASRPVVASALDECLSRYPSYFRRFLAFCQVETAAGQDGSSVVHGSLMVALEHSSGAVRARAVEQLSRAMSSEVEDAADKSTTAMGEDLSPALLRRLRDEEPEVVLAITGSDNLVARLLLRPSLVSSNQDDGEITDVSDLITSIHRAASVTSTCAAAAVPWLLALSEARPKHPVASSGRVLSGLLRLAAAAAAASTAAVASCGGVSDEGLAVAKQARDSALSLFLECLPGPGAIARVKLAQQLASASVEGSGSAKEGDSAAAAAASAAAGKACKKAMRAINRAAIEAICGLSTGAASAGFVDLFACLAAVLDKEGEGEHEAYSKSPGKKKGKKSKAIDAMEVEGGRKSKGFKVTVEEVCDTLASALVGAGGEKRKMEELQVRYWLWFLDGASSRVYKTSTTLNCQRFVYNSGSFCCFFQRLRGVVCVWEMCV